MRARGLEPPRAFAHRLLSSGYRPQSGAKWPIPMRFWCRPSSSFSRFGNTQGTRQPSSNRTPRVVPATWTGGGGGLISRSCRLGHQALGGAGTRQVRSCRCFCFVDWAVRPKTRRWRSTIRAFGGGRLSERSRIRAPLSLGATSCERSGSTQRASPTIRWIGMARRLLPCRCARPLVAPERDSREPQLIAQAVWRKNAGERHIRGEIKLIARCGELDAVAGVPP